MSKEQIDLEMKFERNGMTLTVHTDTNGNVAMTGSVTIPIGTLDLTLEHENVTIPKGSLSKVLYDVAVDEFLARLAWIAAVTPETLSN